MSRFAVETEVGVKGALLKRKDFLGVDERAHSHPNRTYYYRKHQDLDDIIDTCTKKLKLDPNNSQALFLRGSSYFKKQSFTESVRDFDVLLRNQPNHVEGLYNRAMALTKIDQSERAIEDFSRVLAINPDHVNAAFNRATCYNQIGQLDRAIEDYNLALMGKFDINLNSDAGSPVPSDDFGVNDGDMSRLTYQNDGEGSPAVVQRGGAGGAGRGTSNSNGSNYNFSSFDQGDRDSGSTSPMSVRSSGRFSNYHQYSPAATPTAAGSSAQAGFGAYTGSDNYGNMSQSAGLTRSRVNSASGNSLDALSMGTPRPMGLGPRGVSGSSSVLSSSSNNPNSNTNSNTSFNSSATYNQPQGQPNSTSTSTSGLNPIAEEHHARGYQFRKQNKFQEAIQEYTKAIAAEPRHFKALFNRGFAHDKIGLFDLAIADYSRAIEIDSTNSFCYYNRGISNDRKGTLDAAMADFTTAINLQPSNAEFYHNRAFCLRKLGKLTAAMEDYSVSLQLSPNNFKALYNRACCHEKLDQLDAAMVDCNAALSVQPTHGGCLLTKALLLERSNQLPAALAAYTTALQHGADSFLVHSSRAKVHGRMGSYADSINDLSAALDFQRDQGLLFSRAMCYKSLEQFDSAIRDFSEVVALDPKNVASYNHRGYCHRKLEKYDQAIADYSACIQLAPANVRAYNNRAYILAKLARYEEAVEDYSIVIKHDPRSVHAYHNRGISYDKLGLIDQAIADFTKVLELEPQSYGENGMENGGNRQAAAELMHNLQQQQQQQQRQLEHQQNAPPPPPQNAPKRLPSALKSANPNASNSTASSGPQIQSGNFYVPRGAVSSENNPVPKHVERQHVHRPSVGFVSDTPTTTSSSHVAQEETSSVGTDEGRASADSPVDEAALAQHTELGNRLSHMSNLLKGFGAPIQPPISAVTSRASVPASSSRPASVYRAPVPLASQEQRAEPPTAPPDQQNTAPPARLPSAVVPSKWASRINNNTTNNIASNNNPIDSRGGLSIDTTAASGAGPRVSPMALSAASPTPGSANASTSVLSTPGSARSGPVSAAVFLNSLKKPSAPVPVNAQTTVGSAGPVHRFSSQGAFSPRPESNNY